MSRRLAGLLFAILAGFGGAATRADDAALPLEARVNRAIDRAAADLLERQAEDGSWQKEDPVHPLGRTGLCAFALLHAGVPRDHPTIRRALSFLGVSKGYASNLVPHSTYEAGCLALFLNAMGKGYGGPVRTICEWLVANFNPDEGLWGYPDGIPDLSNTQYAVLALRVGQRHGHETPDGIWKRLLDSVLRLQHEDGAVRYRGGAMYRASMTHAGLLVWRFALDALRTRRPSRRVREGMEAAEDWLEKHYDVDRHPYGRGWTPSQYYYYLYGLERYAVFFQRKTIAGHDWYREGAEALLARQKKDGSWGNLEDTCFAILFLRRATLTEPDEHELGAVAKEGPAAEGSDPPEPPRPSEGVPWLVPWLVAGPFPGTKEEDDHLFVGHLDPRRVRPREGARADTKRWERLDAGPDGRIELGKALGELPWASFYAASWLHAASNVDAVLWFASDDGLRVWLDGDEILFGHHHDYSGDDFYRVPVHLPEGPHVLLLQVENLEYSVYARVRVSTPEGKPLPSVTSSLSKRR